MFADLIDAISDLLDGVVDSFNGEDLDSFFDSLSTQGIDLSNYTPDEIRHALDIALGMETSLDVPDADIDELTDKVAGLDRTNHNSEISFEGRNLCPTRHGCTGIAACDYSYGAPT